MKPVRTIEILNGGDEGLEKMKFVEPHTEIVHAARAVGTTFGDCA